MGLTNEAAVFLCEARKDGASFGRTLTLGRQSLYVDQATLDKLAAEMGKQGFDSSLSRDRYSERFISEFLDAREVVSIDHSRYEGASVAHDMNEPVPAELEGRYDAVIDGGTLEHVFNFPTAIASCMKMVRPGGRLFIFTPANNQCGHGFYQFSPELFYRILSPENGFVVERMTAAQHRFTGVEFGTVGSLYQVSDPMAVRSRVTVVNARPLSLFIQARRESDAPRVFAKWPQQSDYAEIWSRAAGEARGRSEPLKDLARFLAKQIPGSAQSAMRNLYGKYFLHTLRNRRFYRPAR